MSFNNRFPSLKAKRPCGHTGELFFSTLLNFSSHSVAGDSLSGFLRHDEVQFPDDPDLMEDRLLLIGFDVC